MDENLEPAASLSRDEMRRLMTRRDGPGLLLFSAQLALFALLSLWTVHLAAQGSLIRFPAVLATGLLLLTFFASMHEAAHGTAFRSVRLGRLVTWISATLMLQAPTFFREFHFEHHRRTSDPDGDPEISGAPALLGPWPGNPALWLALASGQHLMAGKAAFTLACALLPIHFVCDRWFPFVRPALRRRVAWESRVVVLVLGACAAAGLLQAPGFATLLLAWPVAHLGLGLFVMPEHTGLPRSGTQFARTRSTRSNALVRTAMWNMPWHAEHHAFPAVPFHALPALGRRVEAEVANRASGYLAFHAEVLRRSLSR